MEYVLREELSEGKISGAVGSYSSVDPELEKEALAFLGLVPAKAETQILQRDRHAVLLAVIAIAGGTIEQMCRTFWDMMGSDVKELREPRKSAQRGSSKMPAKRNPILTEQFMGLPRLLRGYLIPGIENIATPEFRAIEQSSVERHIFPDATGVLHYLAARSADLVETLIVFPDRMRYAVEVKSLGVWAASKILDALLDAGVDSNEAYLCLQAAGFEAEDQDVHLKEILRRRPLGDEDSRTVMSILGEEKFNQCFDPMHFVQRGVEHIFEVCGV